MEKLVVPSNKVMKVLIIIGAPVLTKDGRIPSPLDYKKEWQNIVSGLKGRSLPISLSRLVPPTWDKLRDALDHDEYAVVHFTGHGFEEGLQFENKYGVEDIILASELGELFKEKKVRLAILNACRSGESEASPAQELQKAGVPAVIATTAPIGDEVGNLLSQQLYTHLASGDSVSDALEKAKEAIVRQFSKEDSSIIILYGDGEIVPFESGRAEAAHLEIYDPMQRKNVPYNPVLYGRGEELVSAAELLVSCPRNNFTIYQDIRVLEKCRDRFYTCPKTQVNGPSADRRKVCPCIYFFVKRPKEFVNIFLIRDTR